MSERNAKRQQDTLEQRFELDEAFLSSPNTAALKSAVIRATDRRTGDPVVLKYWEKAGTAVATLYYALQRPHAHGWSQASGALTVRSLPRPVRAMPSSWVI